MAATGEVARLPPLGLIRLLTEAVNTLARAPLSAWAVILVWALAETGFRIGLPMVMSAYGQPDQMQVYWVSTVGYGLIRAVGGAFLMRACLGLSVRQLDRGVAACILILLAIYAVQILVSALPQFVLLDPAERTIGRTRVSAMTTYWMGWSLTMLMLYPIARLALWPVGRLANDGRASAAYSWRAMGGRAVWIYIGAYLLLIFAPLVVLNTATTAAMMSRDTSFVRLTVLPIASAMLVGIASCVLRVAAYRQRMPRQTRDLGDIFD